ncbi:MAG: peptidoglycan recognition family protein, partial [Planctomycetia bacterium]
PAPWAPGRPGVPVTEPAGRVGRAGGGAPAPVAAPLAAPAAGLPGPEASAVSPLPTVVLAGERGPEWAAGLATRLRMTFSDSGGWLLLSDGAINVRIFPNSHRISLSGEERTLRGFFARSTGGVAVPGPAVRIIEEHVAGARARLVARKSPAAPSVAALPAPRPALAPPRPAVTVAPPASTRKQAGAGWVVDAPARAWKWIVVHHSDDTRGNLAKYHRVHLDKGWEHGCGYHFVIGNGSLSGDGEIEVSQRWTRQLHGAHAKTPDNRFNDFGIGIVLVGDFETGSARPTARQMDALVRLVTWLMERYGIDPGNVQGHGSCKATCCPGRNFPWGELRARLHAPGVGRSVAVPGCPDTEERALPALVPLVQRGTPPAGAPGSWLPGSPPARSLPTTAATVPAPRALPTIPLPPPLPTPLR